MSLKIIDFYAVWCKPCTNIKPILKELQNEYPSVEIVFLDVEDPKNNDIVSKYNVRNIPLLVFEKDGDIVDKLVGQQPKERIIQLIEQHA